MESEARRGKPAEGPQRRPQRGSQQGPQRRPRRGPQRRRGLGPGPSVGEKIRSSPEGNPEADLQRGARPPPGMVRPRRDSRETRSRLQRLVARRPPSRPPSNKVEPGQTGLLYNAL